MILPKTTLLLASLILLNIATMMGPNVGMFVRQCVYPRRVNFVRCRRNRTW